MINFKFFITKNFARLIPSSKIITVTGSIGKTTTVVCIKSVLENRMKTVTSADNVYEQGFSSLAKTVLKLTPKVSKGIFELSCKNDSDKDYTDLLPSQTVVLTNLESTRDLALDQCTADLAEKLIGRVLKDGYLILNWEDNYSRKLSDKNNGTTIFYGFDPQNCDVWAGNLRIENYQTVFELNYGVERVEVRSKLLGFHQVLSMLSAAAVGISLNVPLITIKKGLEKVEPLPHRLSLHTGHNNSLVIDDSYNSDPLSLEQAMDALNRMPARRRILVLGEMKGLGEDSQKMHRLIARRIYGDKVDLLLTGTGDAELINDELEKLGFLPDRMERNQQNPQLVSKLLKILSKGDVVLVKGDWSGKFSEVVKKISKKVK